MVWFEFLAFGAWGFWLLLAVGTISMSELMDNDSPGFATILAIFICAILYVFGGVNPFVWIKNHPQETFVMAVGYFFAGAVWSLVKWYSYLVQARRRMQQIRDDRVAQGKNELQNFALASDAGLDGRFPPQIIDHKSKVIGWIALWPASMVWTLINHPVRRICEEIYYRLGGVYQQISNRVFRDFQ